MSDILRDAEVIVGVLGAIGGAEAALILDAGLRIVIWPTAAERLTGFSSAEAIGREPSLLFAGNGEASRDARCLLDSARFEGRAVSTRPIARKGGDSFWGEIKVSTLRSRKNQLLGYLVQLRDLRACENFVPQLQRLRMLEDALQDAAGVAHDLNNLLTVLLSRLPSDAGGTGEIADRMTALLQHFIHAVRGLRRPPVSVNVNDVVSRVVRTLGLDVGKGMETIVNLDPALSMVYADVLEIEEVLLNLVANARYATPSGGSILIGTSNLHVANPTTRNTQTLQAGDYVRAVVRDSGSGMSVEALAHLFEPFYSTKGEGQGTGLGLSNSLRIVNRLGGTILIESEVGWGTLAEVYLPAAALPPSNRRHN